MSEQAPVSPQDYKDVYPDAVDDVNKAHAMALESNKVRSEAVQARAIGKLILSEVQKGPADKFGRNPGERFASRVTAAEEVLHPTTQYTVSEDMEHAALEKAGLNGPMARQQQLDRFYKGRTAIDNNGGDAEKALDQIEDWSQQLDNEANRIEDVTGQNYDIYNQNH